MAPSRARGAVIVAGLLPLILALPRPGAAGASGPYPAGQDVGGVRAKLPDRGGDWPTRLVTPPTPARASQSRPLDFGVLRSVRQVGAPVLSPDGAEVVFAVSETDGDDGRRSNLWIAAAAGRQPPRRLTEGSFRDGSPAFAPDGRRLAFVSNREEGRQLWVIDSLATTPNTTGSTAIRRLTSLPGGVSRFDWAPDGERLAIVSPAGPGDGPGGGGDHIHLVDVRSGDTRQLSERPAIGPAIDWSPSGDHIAYSSQLEPGFYGGLETDLFLLEVDSGDVRPLVERAGVDQGPEFSPDGETLAFISGFGRSGLLPNLGVALLDVATGEVRDAGRSHDRGGFFEGPTRLEWTPDGGAVYSNASHGIGERIVRLDVATGQSRVFSAGLASYGALDVAGEAPRMALLVSDYDLPGEVFVTDLPTFDPERITHSNPHLADVAFPSAEIVRWRAPDGLEITGLLVLPPDHDPDRRLPLVVSYHGGPASSIGVGFPGLGFFYNPHRDDLLAAAGYAVLLPNFRGSGGFGEAFRRAIVRDWGRGPLADVMAGVDHLIAAGVADPDRLGVMGWSYGGYLAAWTITSTDRFRVASVGAGVFDLESHFGQAAEQMLEYFGGPPWEARDAYEADSPSTYVDRVVTPTQVIHGRDDTAVSPAQGEYLAAALRTLGVPHEARFYADEGHSFRDPDVQEESWRHVRDWFDRWLRPETP